MVYQSISYHIVTSQHITTHSIPGFFLSFPFCSFMLREYTLSAVQKQRSEGEEGIFPPSILHQPDCRIAKFCATNPRRQDDLKR